MYYVLQVMNKLDNEGDRPTKLAGNGIVAYM